MENVKNFNTVWMSLTYDCNNKCGWCYAASNFNTPSRRGFPIEKETETLNLLYSLEVKKIILIGGEPTLYSNIEGILKKINDKGIISGVVSNGRRFSNRKFSRRMKESGLNYITISICGPNAELHDSITQVKGSFYQSMRGLRTAWEEGIDVATNTVISAKNVGELEKMVDLLREEPIKEMTFNICGVCVSEDSNNSYLINPFKAVKSFERAYSHAKSLGIGARLVTPIPICFFNETLIKELKGKQLVTGGPCQLSSGRNFVIEPDGDIVPCTHLAHFPMMNIFDSGKIISKDEFMKKYNDVNETPFRFREKMRKYPSNKCEEPNCNEPCAGGCPLYWLKFDPEKEIKGISSKG